MEKGLLIFIAVFCLHCLLSSCVNPYDEPADGTCYCVFTMTTDGEVTDTQELEYPGMRSSMCSKMNSTNTTTIDGQIIVSTIKCSIR
jgi:hypothetical protein